MLKLCGDSIFEPLEKIFKTSLRNGRSPLEKKKANVVPIQKKGDINISSLKNSHPVSVLPNCVNKTLAL